MLRIKEFIKKETVFCAAAVLAVLTMFFVPPSYQYVQYIDFRVLALLFCLMLVVAGFRSVGVFERMIQQLLPHMRNLRQLVFMLVLVCFFSSMWITNDVALITFVPFAILVLEAAGHREKLIFVITMQTIAANLGSMCTPIGNPQNLYLYSLAEMSMIEFLKLMLPLTVVSLLLLVVAVFMVKPEKIVYEKAEKESGRFGWRIWGYAVLFVLCLLTVLRVIDYRLMLVFVVVAICFLNRRLYRNVDYMLLITFVAFFIFVGNIKNMDSVKLFLESCVAGREVVVAVLASQVISNVPAAVLLSGVTENVQALLIGTNIGGLGTLIASMASLISYKLYIGTPNSRKGRYILEFTLYNLIFLILLGAVTYFL